MARKNHSQSEAFEDVSSYSSSKEYKKRRKNRRGRAVLRGVAVFFCLVFILCGSGMIYVSTNLLADLTTTTIAKDNDTLGIDPESIVMDDSIKNIALFGLDSRSSEFSGRSDVVMILTVDNKHQKLKLTSILRDSEVTIDGERFNGEYIHYTDKINAAYNLGGPELAIRTLNQNFGLDIRDYVTVNFANMAAIVDAFGGVDITMTADEVYELNANLWALSQEVEEEKDIDIQNGTADDKTYPEISNSDYIPDVNGEINLLYGEYSDGTYHLNGNQAVAYGRIRHIGSDYARVVRQQTVFSALVDKVADLSFSEYPNVIKQMMPYCETSLDLSDVMSMAPILMSGFSIHSISVPNIEYETDLIDQTINGVYHMIYNPSTAAERISAFIYEEDSPYWEEYGDTSQQPDATQAVDG